MIKKGIIILLTFTILFFGDINLLRVTGANVNSVHVKSDLNLDSKYIYEQFKSISNDELPSLKAFTLALEGYRNLKNSGAINKDILTVIDFSLPSNEKRLWVIDLSVNQILFNDWVAHGKKSGNNYAKSFSNLPSSNASSIGFYITGETYNGKHGLSLRLDGMDKGFNDNARKRSIVMHGAKYVSGDFIKKYGRLGRSLGCPSVSMKVYKDIIHTIRDGSMLFIYSPNDEFITKSSVLNPFAT